MVKGIVTNKIVFNKRPYPNIDRGGDTKRTSEKFNLFKKLWTIFTVIGYFKLSFVKSNQD